MEGIWKLIIAIWSQQGRLGPVQTRKTTGQNVSKVLQIQSTCTEHRSHSDPLATEYYQGTNQKMLLFNPCLNLALFAGSIRKVLSILYLHLVGGQVCLSIGQFKSDSMSSEFLKGQSPRPYLHKGEAKLGILNAKDPFPLPLVYCKPFHWPTHAPEHIFSPGINKCTFLFFSVCLTQFFVWDTTTLQRSPTGNLYLIIMTTHNLWWCLGMSPQAARSDVLSR